MVIMCTLLSLNSSSVVLKYFKCCSDTWTKTQNSPRYKVKQNVFFYDINNIKKRDNKLLRWVFEHKQIIFSHISSTQLQINIRVIVLGQNNNVHIQKSFLAQTLLLQKRNDLSVCLCCYFRVLKYRNSQLKPPN